jgi:hypothetical protein
MRNATGGLNYTITVTDKGSAVLDLFMSKMQQVNAVVRGEFSKSDAEIKGMEKSISKIEASALALSKVGIATNFSRAAGAVSRLSLAMDKLGPVMDRLGSSSFSNKLALHLIGLRRHISQLNTDLNGIRTTLQSLGAITISAPISGATQAMQRFNNAV